MDDPPKPPRRHRPEAWEDDLSRSALDNQPFSNAPPITACDRTTILAVARQVIDVTWLQDVDLESMIDNDNYPLPGPDDREGYVPDSDVGFWVSGLHDFLKVRRAALDVGSKPQQWLDLGCASGRVLRHFAAQWPDAKLWACDINFRHVRWVLEHLRPDIRCFHAPVLPHLPIADDQIDWTCAFSVFTHLDTFDTGWIAELHRITRRGGYCYVTFQTETTWDHLCRADATDRRRSMIERISPDTAAMLDGPLPSGRTIFRRTQQGPYRGLVFHSLDYLQRLWGRFFEIVAIRPHHHGMDQTVMLFRKP